MRNPRRHRNHDVVHLVFGNRREHGRASAPTVPVRSVRICSRVSNCSKRNRRLQRPVVRSRPFFTLTRRTWRSTAARVTGSSGIGCRPCRNRADHLRIGIIALRIGLRHAQRFERRELLRQLRILRDALRVKLQIDPLLHAHFANRLDVARPRPEGQPVERMEDLLVLRELAPEIECSRLWASPLEPARKEPQRRKKSKPDLLVSKPTRPAFACNSLSLFQLNSKSTEKLAD